ncbi:MAG: NAD(P)-dependent oxidoreductase [Candidatus Bathyarchaeia archaeon]
MWVAEPIPCSEVAVKELAGFAEVEVSKDFYHAIPAENVLGVDGVILGDARFTAESLRGADRLRIVQRFGVGFDTVDLEACAKRGVYVCNMPGLNAVDVAEFAVGALVSSLRGFVKLDESARRLAWQERPSLMGERLKGKTVGIVGLGRIGREVAKRLKPFDVQLLAFDPYVTQASADELDVRLTTLDELVRNSDIITVHAPLNEETRGLIGAKEFDSMKPTAIVLNTARGAVVNEAKLVEALRAGRIKAAVIDVYSREPPEPGNPLFELGNVQLSLHMASWTRQFFEDGMVWCSRNVMRALRGEKPLNIVNAVP